MGSLQRVRRSHGSSGRNLNRCTTVVFSLKCSPKTWNRMQVFGLLNKITEEEEVSLHECCQLCHRLTAQYVIRLLLLSKESKFLNHYNLQSASCLWKQHRDQCLAPQVAHLLPGCQLSASNLLAVLPQLPVGFSGFCICLSACQKDFLDRCCMNILLMFVPSVPLASRWLPTADSPPTLSNWIPFAGMVGASFEREKDDNSWMAHIVE